MTHEQLTDVINAHERTELQEIDHAAFFTALDQPEQATSALKTAFQRYQIEQRKAYQEYLADFDPTPQYGGDDYDYPMSEDAWLELKENN